MSGIFSDLFVLELSTMHRGSLERGKYIIREFSKVVKDNNIKAAIKLQFRDSDNFIHKDFLHRTDIRYIKSILERKMSKENYKILVDEIKSNGLLTAATPFDEDSVRFCGEIGIDIIKVASSDINDWDLLKEIVKLDKPVVLSTGGASEKDIDDVVAFLIINKCEFAINHCISLYPTEWDNLELNQIEYLKNKYADVPIGFSTHEYDNEMATYSIAMAYAKGARMFERHIDIEEDDIVVSPYCSTPDDIDKWIKAYKKAVRFCGGSPNKRRDISEKEVQYLDALKRGVFLNKDVKTGDVVTRDDVYFAIPLQKGQISVKEFTKPFKITWDLKKHSALPIVFTADNDLDIQLIMGRGL